MSMRINVIKPASWIREGRPRPARLQQFAGQTGSPATDRNLAQQQEEKRVEERRRFERRDEKRPTVLIVDDDEGMRQTLNFVLRKSCNVLVAASGEEALRVLETQTVQVCFLDFTLPGIDGLEVLAAIRERWPWISVTVISESGDPMVKRTALELGAFHYMRKEFDFDWMNSLLETAIASFETHQEVQMLHQEILALKRERDVLRQQLDQLTAVSVGRN